MYRWCNTQWKPSSAQSESPCLLLRVLSWTNSGTFFLFTLCVCSNSLSFRKGTWRILMNSHQELCPATAQGGEDMKLILSWCLLFPAHPPVPYFQSCAHRDIPGPQLVQKVRAQLSLRTGWVQLGQSPLAAPGGAQPWLHRALVSQPHLSLLYTAC